MCARVLSCAVSAVTALLLFLCPGGILVRAEEPPLTALVATREVSDREAVPGDLVVYDTALGAFRRARSGDSGEFGVVAAEAHLLFRTSATATPVVQRGTTLLRVSTLAGAIAVGDVLTLSPMPGIAMRVGEDDDEALPLALAREAFVPSLPEVPQGEEPLVAVGTIIVDLSDEAIGRGTATSEKGAGGEPESFFSAEPLRFATLVRFLIAALVTAATILFAYRMYEKNLLAGITSIGRNPLAKTPIQVMMGANIVLVTFVAAAGLAVSILIIVL